MLNLSPRTWLRPMLVGSLLLASAIAGCAGLGKTDPSDEPAAQRETPRDAGDAGDDDVASSAQAMADRLAEAMTRGSGELPLDDLTAEQWEQIRTRQTGPREPVADPADETASADTDLDGEPEGVASPEAAAERDGPDPLSRREVLALLAEHIRASDDSAMSKGLTAAAVSLADAHHEVDPAVLASLDERQRASVAFYQDLLLTLGQELAQGGEIQRDTIDRRLDELFRDRPLEIRMVALCRRVAGFGVYDTFPSTTFLAGRDQRVIVYSELEHFRPHRLDDGQYEVKLDQEVVLYNESDGLAVWRHEPVRIADQSQNRRRDFFVVQMITLPARLSVGKYRMKVRITDVHGDSLDETTLPIELVADASLVRGSE